MNRTLRTARQAVETDRLLGMDFVHIGNARVSGAFSAMETVPATFSPTAEAPVVPSVKRQLLAGPAPAPGRLSVRASLDREEKAAALAELARETEAWVQGNWPRDGWRKFVFGEGDPAAQLMFIGEGPGAEEDAQGRPFVGPAGKLLDKQIVAMGLAREQVYIANIAKTRPPGNRVPTPDEAGKWMPWLERQIQIIGPSVIVALGATSSKYLLNDPKLAITKFRGQWCSFRGIDLICTFHPAYLLRSYTVENRRRVWDDLQKVLERLGMDPPQSPSTDRG